MQLISGPYFFMDVKVGQWPELRKNVGTAEMWFIKRMTENIVDRVEKKFKRFF